MRAMRKYFNFTSFLSSIILKLNVVKLDILPSFNFLITVNNRNGTIIVRVQAKVVFWNN